MASVGVSVGRQAEDALQPPTEPPLPETKPLPPPQPPPPVSAPQPQPPPRPPSPAGVKAEENCSFLPLVHNIIKCMDKDSPDVQQDLNALRTKFQEMRKVVGAMPGIHLSPERQQQQLHRLREQSSVWAGFKAPTKYCGTRSSETPGGRALPEGCGGHGLLMGLSCAPEL
ncbi:mediator of RNA polymerase II transcription subunit 9 isoform X1 [Pseudorca crassidens]|uniref:mediator of RNA polymerase II transcription subunit 9 isoform X1 n=1 Tax=Pseudorca crassidens TaxID=82174 RepID=UPI00352DEA7D